MSARWYPPRTRRRPSPRRSGACSPSRRSPRCSSSTTARPTTRPTGPGPRAPPCSGSRYNQGQAQAIMAGARAIDDADIFLIVDGDVGAERGRGTAAAHARPRGRGRHDDREPAARGDRRVRDGEEDRAVGGPPGDRAAAQGADLGPAGDARRPPPVDEAERALRVLGLAEHRRQPRRRPDPRGRRPADAPAHRQDAQRLRAPREAGLLPPASPLAAAHLEPLPDRGRRS